MLEEFKSFITRGRVVDLAVGIVIGVAFASLVKSLVANVVTPLITIPGEVDFSNLEFTIGGGKFRYGEFLNDLISFLVIAGAVFVGVVRPLGRLSAKADAERAEATKTCAQCLSTIPAAASRCAFCTSEQ